MAVHAGATALILKFIIGINIIGLHSDKLDLNIVVPAAEACESARANVVVVRDSADEHGLQVTGIHQASLIKRKWLSQFDIKFDLLTWFGYQGAWKRPGTAIPSVVSKTAGVPQENSAADSHDRGVRIPYVDDSNVGLLGRPLPRDGRCDHLQSQSWSMAGHEFSGRKLQSVGTGLPHFVGRGFQGKCEISYGDGRESREKAVVVVNEISESEYERHVTSGWLLLGGLAAFAAYVIWDQTRKR